MIPRRTVDCCTGDDPPRCPGRSSAKGSFRSGSSAPCPILVPSRSHKPILFAFEDDTGSSEMARAKCSMAASENHAPRPKRLPFRWNRKLLWPFRVRRHFYGEPVSTPDQVRGRLCWNPLSWPSRRQERSPLHDSAAPVHVGRLRVAMQIWMSTHESHPPEPHARHSGRHVPGYSHLAERLPRDDRGSPDSHPSRRRRGV
jgi:hypothetical protein